MTTDTQARRGYRFGIALMTGACVGAGVLLWLAPQALSELRRRMTVSAENLVRRGSGRSRGADTPIDTAVDDLTDG